MDPSCSLASSSPDLHNGTVKTDTPGAPCPCTLWMMGDDRLSEPPKPMGLLNIYLGDDLQLPPGVHSRGPPEPPQEHTWASDPSGPTSADASPRGPSMEPTSPEAGPSQGAPRQSQSTSTQVVFWAGILQAQMCVLDLEEELEKTEGLRAELRSCLPTAPADLPPFCSLASPRDSGLHPGPPVEEASGEDSSGPEGEDQDPAWLGEGTPVSSLDWGAEEESLFFDNPLFLESPCSDSASEPRFSWGLPDSADVRPDSPQTLEPPVPGCGVPWGQGNDPDSGDSTSDSSGHATPPFPVPAYKPHAWALVDAARRTPAAPPGWGSSEVSGALETGPGGREGPALLCGHWAQNTLQRPDPGVNDQESKASVAFRAVGSSLDAMMSAEHKTLMSTASPCCQTRGWCLAILGTGSSSTYSLFPAFLGRHPSHLPTVAAGSAAKGDLCP